MQNSWNFTSGMRWQHMRILTCIQRQIPLDLICEIGLLPRRDLGDNAKMLIAVINTAFAAVLRFQDCGMSGIEPE
jgi:hypothetical protein